MTTQIERPGWAEGHRLMQEYYDQEWGIETHDDRRLFEMLCLESYQSGLSWMTVLKKRTAFREVFHQFDVARIAQMTTEDFDRLMHDERIIRNRLKLAATINNAKVVQKLVEQGESLNHYLWKFVDFKSTRLPNDGTSLPSQTDLSIQISKQMKKDGFTFVGPVTIYSFMLAVGMVNARL